MMLKLRTSVLTLFPQMFPGPLGHSLAGKALNEGQWILETINIREFSHLKHNKVDDTSVGGGDGLIIRADILDHALTHTLKQHKTPPKLIYFSPRGKPLTQQIINSFLEVKDLILLCGRYEGVDQRIIKHHEFEELSIGDYVLSGGELPALVFLDALVRKLILKNQNTLASESFEDDLLEYPQYTLPRIFHDLSVPDILLSGNHQEIQKWRHQKSVEITKERRPDLWEKYLQKITSR